MELNTFNDIKENLNIINVIETNNKLKNNNNFDDEINRNNSNKNNIKDIIMMILMR